jgi:hypothetical protein
MSFLPLKLGDQPIQIIYGDNVYQNGVNKNQILFM